MISEEQYAAIMAEAMKETPYGTKVMAPTAALQKFSVAGQEAARNLLVKALRKLEAGETGAADRLIARAVALPFDEHEEFWPGPVAAHQMLFNLLSDQAEDMADFLAAELELGEGMAGEPPVPLVPAVRRVAEDVDAVEGGVLREIVESMASDGDYHGIDPDQAQRLVRAVSGLPVGVEEIELAPDTSAEERESLIRANLSLILRFEADLVE